MSAPPPPPPPPIAFRHSQDPGLVRVVSNVPVTPFSELVPPPILDSWETPVLKAPWLGNIPPIVDVEVPPPPLDSWDPTVLKAPPPIVDVEVPPPPDSAWLDLDGLRAISGPSEGRRTSLVSITSVRLSTDSAQPLSSGEFVGREVVESVNTPTLEVVRDEVSSEKRPFKHVIAEPRSKLVRQPVRRSSLVGERWLQVSPVEPLPGVVSCAGPLQARLRAPKETWDLLLSWGVLDRTQFHGSLDWKTTLSVKDLRLLLTPTESVDVEHVVYLENNAMVDYVQGGFDPGLFCSILEWIASTYPVKGSDLLLRWDPETSRALTRASLRESELCHFTGFVADRVQSHLCALLHLHEMECRQDIREWIIASNLVVNRDN